LPVRCPFAFVVALLPVGRRRRTGLMRHS
jgi:hypothetical protein